MKESIGRVKGKTSTGFEYDVDPNFADDWELLENLTSGTAKGEIEAAKTILGDDQYKKLKDHCRDDNGKVSAIKMDAELGEVIEATSKN